MAKKSSIVVAKPDDIAVYDVFDGMDEVTSIIQANVGTMDNLTEFSLPRAINGAGTNNRWEIPGLGEDSEMVSEIEGIIVYHTPARARYIVSYDESGGGGTPDCISRDGIHGEGSPGGLCPKCEYARFTKDSDGQTVAPECNLVKRLFILRPGEIMPTMFNALSGNVQQAETYMFNLSVKGRLRFNHCITKISVTKDKYKNNRDWMKWNFSMVAKLPPEAAAQMDNFTEFLKPIVSDMDVTAEDLKEDDGPY